MKKDLPITYKIDIQRGHEVFYEMAARYYLENDAIDMVPGEIYKNLFKYVRMNHAMEAIRPLTRDMGIIGEYQTVRRIL